MLSSRLQEFLSAWCVPETPPGEVADMLHGPDGGPYRDWLKRDLLAAARAGDLTPEHLSELTGAAFDDQRVVLGWLRAVWPLWFSQAYPG